METKGIRKVSKGCWNNWNPIWKRVNVDLYLISYTKINSKWTKELHSVNLYDPGVGSGFLDMHKTWATKEKIGKLDFIKIKNFCASKDNNKKVKKMTHKMEENICKSYIW